MGDLPLVILVHVHVGVPGLDLIARGSHGKLMCIALDCLDLATCLFSGGYYHPHLVDTGILAPPIADSDITLDDLIMQRRKILETSSDDFHPHVSQM